MASPHTPNLHPVVLDPISLASFIQHIIKRQTTKIHLISCTSQADFLSQLLISIASDKDVAAQLAEAAGFEPRNIERLISRPHDLLIPTIHQLSISSNINVTFCASLPQLHAFLGTYALKGDEATEMLALVNPIALHRDTASHSAQGISRTFASAVEAAVRGRQRLLLVECPSSTSIPGIGHDEDDEDMQDDGGDVSLHREEITSTDPWAENVSILNVATKSFGAGEKGWVGRTVSVKRIAKRWFRFERP